MHRVVVTQSERELAKLVGRVCSEGITLELEMDDKVVAQLSPVAAHSPLHASELNAFLERLPRLEDDAEAFLNDLRSIRRGATTEADPWA